MKFILYCTLIIIVSFGLAGCKGYDKQVVFSGISEHWEGKLVRNNETGKGEFIILPKNVSAGKFKDLEVNINNGKIILGRKSLTKGEQISKPISKEMLIYFEGSETIEIIVYWDSKYSEEIELTS